jgi:hypothetical protein
MEPHMIDIGKILNLGLKVLKVLKDFKVIKDL